MAKKRPARVPRTATGKEADPDLLASAERASRAGMKERTEAGHLLAGRTPPSREAAPPRHSGAVQLVEDAIRESIARAGNSAIAVIPEGPYVVPVYAAPALA